MPINFKFCSRASVFALELKPSQFTFIYHVPFKFRVSRVPPPPKIGGKNFKPLKLKGSEIKREKIWEFSIKMFVSLKEGEMLKFWHRWLKIKQMKIKKAERKLEADESGKK